MRLGSVLGALLLAALAWGVVTTWQASEREQLARRFTEQVEEMEAIARYSHMSPLHDVRPDRELIRQRMDRLRSEMNRSAARAPGHYALGRGHLALGDAEAAYGELSAAWDAGYREPEARAALALALSDLYREGLAAAELLGDWESRERRLRRLEEDYGEPARGFLAPGSADGTAVPASQHYLEVLALFHAGHFDEALERLAEVEDRPAWTYELDALEGDVRRSLAIRLHVDNDAEGARKELEHAYAADERAAKVAPSDPDVLLGGAQIAALHAKWEVLTGEDLSAVLDRGLRSVGQALEANPDDAHSWLWRARLDRLAARALQVRSEDPLPRLTDAAEAAKQAAALMTDPSEAALELGQILWTRARWLQERGDDPTPVVVEAVEALGRVEPAWRDYVYYVSLGTAYTTLADHRHERGDDARGYLDQAIAAHRSATEHHSKPFAALSNLGVGLFKRADLEPPETRVTALREAAAVFEQARDLDPDHVAPHYYLGQIYLRLAQGGNPASGLLGDEVQLALDSNLRALELNPKMVILHNAIGVIYHLQGIHAWELGGDPEPYFALARREFAAGLAAAPRHVFFHQNLAWTAYFQGKFRLRSAGDSDRYLDEAMKLSKQALSLSVRPSGLLSLGSVYRLKAESAVRDGEDPRHWFELSERQFREILKINPSHAEAHRSLGRLYTLEGRWRASRQDDPESAFLRALETLEDALALEPTVAYFHLAKARWALERVRWRPATDARETGLEAVDEALKLRPSWKEASEVRHALEKLP